MTGLRAAAVACACGQYAVCSCAVELSGSCPAALEDHESSKTLAAARLDLQLQVHMD